MWRACAWWGRFAETSLLPRLTPCGIKAAAAVAHPNDLANAPMATSKYLASTPST